MEQIHARLHGTFWLRIAVWLTLIAALAPAVRAAAPAAARTDAGPDLSGAAYSSSAALASVSEAPLLVRSAMMPLPRVEQPRFADRAFYVAIAGYRTMDLISTQHAIGLGAREVELPQWVVANTATFAAFEGLATAGEVGTSVWLIHHHHRRLARTINMVSVSLGTNTVLHNYHQSLWAPVTGGR